MEKYELMKLTYFLNKESKCDILKNWDSISDIFTKEIIDESSFFDNLLNLEKTIDKEDFGNKVFILTKPLKDNVDKSKNNEIVHLINRLYNLAKIFEKEYKSRKEITPNLENIRVEFKDKLNKVKNKIENNKKIKIKIKKENFDEAPDEDTLAQKIDRIASRVGRFDVVSQKKILSKISFGFPEDFEKEIKKEINSKIK